MESIWSKDDDALSKGREINICLDKQNASGKPLTLSLTDTAKEFLSLEGYDPVFGARPLKRVIQRELQNPLATKILDGSIKEGETVEVNVKDGVMEFRNK